MPQITCPYCQVINPSKFAHKQHLRTNHTALFENNIKTSITGATTEITNVVHDVLIDDPSKVVFDNGTCMVSLRIGFDQYNIRILSDLLFNQIIDRLREELQVQDLFPGPLLAAPSLESVVVPDDALPVCNAIVEPSGGLYEDVSDEELSGESSMSL